MRVQLVPGKSLIEGDFEKLLDSVRRTNVRVSVSFGETYVRVYSLEALHDVLIRLGGRLTVRASHRSLDGAVLVVTVEAG